MKLYNTLTRKIDPIDPLAPPSVTVYTCGPTVYDYPHVGNWFTFVRYDLLVRVIRSTGLNPKWVMNITDVGHLVSDADDGEDKLEKGARRENKTAWDVARMYTDYFVASLERLNITTPDYLPKATEHIAEQIELIQALESKGFTYATDDGIYYDTSKFPGYAAFARLDLDDLQEGARVTINDQKRNPADFALWKFSPNDHKRDMEWPSPWGVGFPGWHLECSAMSMKYLGDTIDIHSGGIDHVPVHHTNEIAQSEAVTGKRFANYWMHANHLTVSGDKISKSLGNGFTLEDIESRGFDLAALRLHIIESHYRSQSKFSWESLEAAQNRLKNLQAWADLRFQSRDDAPTVDYADFRQAIQQHLENDLGTPAALSVISQIVDSQNDGVASGQVDEFVKFLDYLNDCLGIDLLATTDIDDDQKRLISEREKVRAAKDWPASDRLRDDLAEQGIAVRDTARGTIWRRL